jgi:hypothetical protein
VTAGPFFVFGYDGATRRLSITEERADQAALDALRYALTGSDAG